MKFDKGDLVFDRRLNMAGMVLGIEEYPERRTGTNLENVLWYKVMLFGDSWCVDGKTRDYTVNHGDNLLEAYNEKEHKGLSRDEAEHDIDDLCKVFIESSPYEEYP